MLLPFERSEHRLEAVVYMGLCTPQYLWTSLGHPLDDPVSTQSLCRIPSV